MTQIQLPRQPQAWGAFLPQVTVHVRRADPMGPSGMVSVGEQSPGFTTVRRTALGGRYLGQANGQATYLKAKQEVARFDGIALRAASIANKTVRDQIAGEFGLNEPSNKDKALYMRNAVAGDIAVAEGASPINYYFFEAPGPQRRRPDALAAFNNDFESAVHDAEVTYGTLPAPITNTITQTIQSPLTVPILIGAGVVAAALLFS